MAKKKKAKTKKRIKIEPAFVQPQKPCCSGDKTLAIIGLIVNIIILPGLGSIIGGRIKTGIWQLVLFVIGCFIALIGIPLSLILIGIPMVICGALLAFAIWIWGIVTGVQMIQC